ncbi:DNA recombination protein RmuC [Marinobacterium arenosum]|uniref:DNA recombination protein RmuC n=1 Tax=Marinobacterium arenosum TaxID=2862496 RepID=UPI001C939185|nr:DNA recombination protein RmuC [Marinobacterium arenosum]MBY4676353.1 DNA recombination protein RmuC [Marinobacterium arenosum]
MDATSLLIGLLPGLLGCGLLLWRQQLLRNRWQQQQHQLELEQTRLQTELERLPQLEQRQAELQQQRDQLQRVLAARSEAVAELETRLAAEREAHADKLATLQEAREQLKVEFQQLANRIFEDKSAKFSSANQQQIGHLLTPLREQLGEFKRRVEDSYDKESKDRRALYEQIQQLKQLNQQMSQDALNLTNALKGESKAQGNWGELVLERVLEQSGLRKGYEYEVQVSLNQQGRRYLPDVIVRLPDDKDVIVDSKVSLTAYERYCSSDDETERQRYLQEHLQSLRGHIKGLGDKAYQQLEGIRSLDFVLLFVPVEGAFLLALEQDSNLFGEAFERNIILVSPATLLVTLRTIHNIWRYEYQNRNAQEIARRGGELYDKFVGFIESLDELGRHLDRTQQAYETARKRLSSGRGNLVNQAAALQKLGVAGKKKLPRALSEQARDSDPQELES